MGALEGLGKFHIWTSLIFGPILFLLVVAVIVVVIVENSTQRGWEKTTAHYVSTISCTMDSDNSNYQCSVQVSLDSVKGKLFTLHVSSNTNVINPTTSWNVHYKQGKVQESLSTVISKGSEVLVVTTLSVVALFILAIWVLNLKLRNNQEWQQVSGVMEGANLLSGVIQSV